MTKPRVIVPIAPEPHPETLRALDEANVHAEYVALFGDDAYWQLLAELWRIGETVFVVEHDIAPRPSCFQELLDCPAPWCGFAYSMSTSYHAALGCTKLSAELMQRFPLAMEAAGEQTDDGWPRRHWKTLDARLARVLAADRLEIHHHWPPVAHFNPEHAIASDLVRGYCRWIGPAEPHKCSRGHDCPCYGRPDGHGCPAYDDRGRLHHAGPDSQGIMRFRHPLEDAA
ncbi:MAG: hypothetical protein KGJ86_17315 [Chloroflexota bacterium]|nr:hypothetical protein [Chloroflexota bacterium]